MIILRVQNILIMRYFYLLLAGLLACAHVGAQELKRVEPEFSDFLPLLKLQGYEMYSFDVSSLQGGSYDISFSVKEYEKGTFIKNAPFSLLFPSERIRSYKKVNIGFSPAADSLKNVTFIVGEAGLAMETLALKPLEGIEQNGRYRIKYAYDIRPFEVGDLQPGVFTPLLLLGSYWFDSGGYRFCGEEEFPADMSSRTLPLLPHYYVIGMTVIKQE